MKPSAPGKSKFFLSLITLAVFALSISGCEIGIVPSQKRILDTEFNPPQNNSDSPDSGGNNNPGNNPDDNDNDDGNSGGGFPPIEPSEPRETCPAGQVLSGDTCIPFQSAEISSVWHPDPDGDGVSSATDSCPDDYNPDQNPNGSPCSSQDKPKAGDFVTDLRIQHVTPYGAWFTFTSPENNDKLGWKGGLTCRTQGAILNPSDAGNARASGLVNFFSGSEGAVRTRFGDEVSFNRLRELSPLIMIKLEPNTDYHCAVFEADNNGAGSISRVSNPVFFKTDSDPIPAGNLPPLESREIWATADQIQAAKNRFQSGDPLVVDLVESMTSGGNQSRIARAGRNELFASHRYCNAAALLFHITGEGLEHALAIHEDLITKTNQGDFDGRNDYRREARYLGQCTNLLRAQLTEQNFQSAMNAMHQLDRRADSEFNGKSVFTAAEEFLYSAGDTDEGIATPVTLLLNGLLTCHAGNLEACKSLDLGKRYFFGFQLVKTYRTLGKWGQSCLPDGVRYSLANTAGYWLEGARIINNAGFPLEEYTPWLRNTLMCQLLHSENPNRQGFAIWGDTFDGEMAPPPNEDSHGFSASNLATLLPNLIHWLDTFGLNQEARWARSFYDHHQVSSNNFHIEHALLWLGEHIAGEDHRGSQLFSTFIDKGMSLGFIRPNWNGPLLTFKSGWNGVDHTHHDTGNFNFNRGGQWILHESPGQELTTHGGPKAHNVLQLSVAVSQDFENPDIGLSLFNNNADVPQGILRFSLGADYFYQCSDTTGAYVSGYLFKHYFYNRVQRCLFWLMGNNPDTVIVYDLVDANGSHLPFQQSLSYHFPVSANAINQNSAQIISGNQQVEIDFHSTANLNLVQGNASGLKTNPLVATGTSSDPNSRTLTSLQFADAGTGKLSTTMLGNNNLRALQIGSSLVVFPEAVIQRSGGLNQGTLNGVGNANLVFLTGLIPNASYIVEKNGDSLSFALGSGVSADDGGVLVVSF